MNIAAVATTFVVIFLAELPDKTMITSLMLGTRLRPLWVWLGVSLAFLVHVSIAVAAGGLLSLAPQNVVKGIVAALFAAGAAVLLFGHGQDDKPESGGEDDTATAAPAARSTDPTPHGTTAPDTATAPDTDSAPVAAPATAPGKAAADAPVQGRTATRSSMGFWATVGTGFGLIFLGEWGDITQIGTANLAAKWDPLSVGVGAAIALLTVSAIGIAAGRLITRWVPMHLVQRAAGMIMAVLAVATLVEIVS